MPFAMEGHSVGALVGETALTMIHGIRLPSYDTTFPLSAESALSCTITGGLFHGSWLITV